MIAEVWRTRRKTIASAVVIALVAGGTLTVAALHPGFPVSDVDLTSRDVWVTNGERLLGGRLNKQIDELNASITTSSAATELLQQGDSVFVVDPDNDRLESVDPATTSITSSVDLPPDAEVSYGGDVIAVVAKGKLWALSAVGDLRLDVVSQPPLLDLGPEGKAVVTASGAIVAVSPTEKKLYRIPTLADVPIESAFPKIGAFELAAIGERVVALDTSTNELVLDDGTVRPLGEERALRLQLSGPASDSAVLATGSGLLRVNLGSGEVQTIDAELASPTSNADDVAAPANVAGCAHGAWAQAQRYLLACAGQDPASYDIDQPTAGARLEFRVNRDIVVLNNLDNGNVWLPAENMRLVDNWDDVIPPKVEETEEEGDEKSALQSFEDTLAERTDENRPPTAIDDEFGIREGRTTILSVLDNDTDPDGDVLVISDHSAIAETTGTLDYIDGRRALQFTPAPGYVGSVNFSYTVDDGRGGTATANVTARVVPDGTNQQPIELRKSAVSVEANQTIDYNVLANWRDPDGDELFLVGAAPLSGDLVRFTPDGVITFTHQTSELGEKEVQFQVTDSQGDPVTGTLTIDVKPAGSLTPVGTPDFASVFVGESVVIKPLENDLSPNGGVLAVTAIQDPGEGASATLDTDDNTVTFQASKAGIYYFTYNLTAGSAPSVGIIRVDVQDIPADLAIPPVAVKDTAYLRPDQPTVVSVLSNDVSPTGRILAVQSVTVPPEVQAKGVVVELLEATLVRVTSPQALTEQVSFTYTISDGLNSSSAGVTIVPVPALTKHQPPIAVDDLATVRAGDIVTVPVLKNDTHPDDSRMFLDDTLVTEPTAGIAFVSGDSVRFQAPTTPGQYTASYRVLDPYGESAAATVRFTVTPPDEKGDLAPRPVDVTARVLAGGSIRIDLPLDGIDPDGDSTYLLRTPTGATLGTIDDGGENWIRYTAAQSVSGTDEFDYQVYDAYGKTGTAKVRIAVIPPPGQLMNPNPVPDSISVRPGRIAQIDLTANDSDPQGSPIRVAPELIDVPPGVEAKVVDKKYLVLKAPAAEGAFALRYTLLNALGGSQKSYVQVQVSKDAPLLPPSASDLTLTLKQIAGKKSVTVDVFDGSAFNPSGSNSELVVSLEGPNASSGQLVPDQQGKITVTPGETRQAIAYRVTNEQDELSATAFIVVPAAVDDSFDDPPRIDPNLPVQYVSMNESREWKLSDILQVPSGREAWIPDATSVSSIQSDRTSNYVDKGTIRFQGARDYRGPASVTFTVTDGASKDDPKGNTQTLTLRIVVGDPEFRDTPPTFTTPNIQLEVGEEASLDLRSATGHPNPQILQDVTYSDVTGLGGKITGSLSGSTLTVTTPRSTPKGTSFTLGVTLRWDKFTVPGTITVTVVGSTRAPALAAPDSYETQRGDGAVIASPLINDSNPYASTGEPLTIVGTEVQNSGEPAGVTFTDSTVSITPSPSLKAGTIVVVYTIQDATKDPDRETKGTITVVVSDVPDQPQKPTVPSQGDERTVELGFQAPASNGKEITSYEVRSTPAVTMPTNCTPPSCVITGLDNGTSYQFSVRAINVHGPGAWSAWSDAVIPYGTPQTPSNVAITVSDQWTGTGSNANTGSLSASWTASGANGGTVRYEWQLYRGGSAVSGKSGTTTVTNTGAITGLDAGTYTVRVTAVNSGNKRSAEAASTPGTITLQSVPTAPSGLTANTLDGDAPNGRINWTWNATSAPTGGTANLSYEVSFNGGGWQNVGTALSYGTAANLGQGSYSLSVRAVNKSGAGGQAGPVSASIAAEPRNPSINIVGTSSTTYTCSNGNFACKRVAVQFTDTSGNYAIYIETSGGTSSSNSVPGSGVRLTNGLQASMPAGWQIRVVATGGPDGTLYSPWLNTAQWDDMRINRANY
ncbi:MAG: hypothetical protein DI534_06370 [Leifsonia xyli]|nr:MAG: hypothetical protein DI534_06370 [Leifsonia xyli]